MVRWGQEVLTLPIEGRRALPKGSAQVLWGPADKLSHVSPTMTLNVRFRHIRAATSSDGVNRVVQGVAVLVVQDQPMERD
jgi:hypothetical protein